MAANPPETADTTPTRYVDVAGDRIAYRTIGAERVDVLPLVLAQRFRGVMDQWDPALLDRLAADRPVYWFDSTGIGLSSGSVPPSIPGMADVLIAFTEALGIGRCDLLGWSMGGYIAQTVAWKRPDLVRRLIVAGSGPGSVPDAPAPPAKVMEIASKPVNVDEDYLYLFYPETPSATAAGRAQLARLGNRREPAEPMVPMEGVQAQLASFGAFRDRDAILPHLPQMTLPILYANGTHDIMIPTFNCFAAAQAAPNARLVLYPDAGHGFLFQYAEAFAREVDAFLSAELSEIGMKNA